MNGLLRYVYGSLVNCHCAYHAAQGELDTEMDDHWLGMRSQVENQTNNCVKIFVVGSSP